MDKRLLIILLNFITVLGAKAQGTFSVSDITTNSISLQWNKQTGSVTSYQVQFRNIGTSDSFSVLTTTTNLDDTTFLHTGLPEGRGYEYKLLTGSGTPVVFSELLGTSGYARPERPLISSATQSATSQIFLEWTDNSAAESGFLIEASINGSADFQRIGSALPANTSSSTISGLKIDSSYRFRVQSFVVNTNKTPSDTVYSGYSEVSNVLTMSETVSAPGGLISFQVEGLEVLEFRWTDFATNESGFELQLSNDNGVNWSNQRLYPANTVSTYYITGLETGTTYIGRVRAYIVDSESPTNEKIYSSFSNVSTPIFLFPRLVGPKNLVVQFTPKFSELDITWDDEDMHEDKFELEVSLDIGLTWTKLADIPKNTGSGKVTYRAVGLLENLNYDFRVASTNIVGKSPYSNIASIITRPSPPRAPSGLITQEVRMDVIIFSWVDNSDNEERFVLERSLDNGITWIVARVLEKNSTTAFDFGLENGTNYLYRVKSENISGFAISNVIGTMTRKLVVPNGPQNLKVVVLSDKEVRLTWDNSTDEDLTFNTNVRKKNVLRYYALNKLQNEIELDRNASSITLTNLLPKVDYGFIVLAVNDAGESGSGFAYATLFGPPSAPTSLATSETFNNLGDRYFNLGWRDNSNDEDGFIISAGNTPSTLKQVARISPDKTSFFHFPMDEGVSWYYTIKAFNKYGESSETNMVRMDVSYTKAPNAPYHFRGEYVQASKWVRLSWLDDSIRESSFDIYRSSNNGASFERIASLPRNTLSYLDVNVSLGVTYQYRIQAINPFGGSAFAGTISVPILSAQAQLSSEFIQVFPNPTAGILFLDNQTGVDLVGARIDIISEVGRTLLSKEWKGSADNVNLQSLKPGTYTIRVTTEQGVAAKKVYKY